MERPKCIMDGCNNLAKICHKKYFYKFCSSHYRKHYGYPVPKQGYKKHDNNKPCSYCGFIPLDKCQMDRDHINGNHGDNRPENIQILCANCHRLKSKLNNEGIYTPKTL